MADSPSAASSSSDPASATGQSQSKKAKKQSKAAAANSLGLTLHAHALQSIFAFLALRDLCSRQSHVSRAWHSAAQCMPTVRAWLRLSQLGDGQLEDVSRALTDLSIVRQANGASKRRCLAEMRNKLRREKCFTASKPMRDLFESVQIVRKNAGEKEGYACMRFTLTQDRTRLLPPPPQRHPVCPLRVSV